jgi:DNA-binding transcriptional LysR family regulator
MIDFRLFRQLWYFLALAEERHFGRAAKRLGISQPPLTQQIQMLEQTLRVRLFERSRSQTTLTPAGLAILPSVQRLAEQAARLESIVMEVRNGVVEQVTIGAINSAIVGLLPTVIRDVRLLFPGANIALFELDSTTAWERLVSKEIDIAFGRYDRHTGDVKVAQLADDRLLAAIPSTNPLAWLRCGAHPPGPCRLLSGRRGVQVAGGRPADRHGLDRMDRGDPAGLRDRGTGAGPALAAADGVTAGFQAPFPASLIEIAVAATIRKSARATAKRRYAPAPLPGQRLSQAASRRRDRRRSCAIRRSAARS